MVSLVKSGRRFLRVRCLFPAKCGVFPNSHKVANEAHSCLPGDSAKNFFLSALSVSGGAGREEIAARSIPTVSKILIE